MMLLKLTLKNIRDKWIRFLLTSLAVVLGVGFVVGTFVITDGLRSTFGDLAVDIAGGADLFVQPDQEFGDDDLGGKPLPTGLVDQIDQVDGVTFAEGVIFRPGVNVLDADGERIGTQFSGGLSWGRGNSTFLVTEGPLAGEAPNGGDEFAMNFNSATDAELVIGEKYLVDALGEPRNMTLTGVFNWADPDEDQTLGGLLISVDVDTAIDFFTGGAGLNQIAIGVTDEATEPAVQAAVGELVGSDFEVITNELAAEEQAADFDEFLDIFGNVLLAFAVVTLVVSAFIIYNTFAIVIGQRVRELGLLRAVGATGRQVAISLIGESIFIGIFATLAGIIGGIGIAWVLRAVLTGLGAGFPDGPLPVEPRTIIVGLILGIGVTVVSAIAPTMRARRVPPIAALRDDVTVGTGEITRRPRLGLALIVTGLCLLVLGMFSGAAIGLLGIAAALFLYFGGSRTRPFLGRFSLLFVGLVLLVFAAVADLDTIPILTALAIGALLTFVGVNLVSPLFAGPVSRLIGTKGLGVVILVLGVVLSLAAAGSLIFGITRAADGSIGGLVGMVVVAAIAAAGAWLCWTTWRAPWGVEGHMGTGNAMRSPRRTSSTAAALMIGLALVGTVTVIGSSLKKTLEVVLNNSVQATWFVCLDDCNSQFDGFSSAFARDLEALPEIESVIRYRQTFEPTFRTLVDGAEHTVFTVDFENLTDHIDPSWVAGDPTAAGPGSMFVHEDSANDRGWTVGDQVDVEFATGEPATFTIAAIHSDARIMTNWVISNDDFDRYMPPIEDFFVSALNAPGFSDEDARPAVDAVAEGYPGVTPRTKDEFRALQSGQVDQALVVINVLLALALIIALVGIANTLALSVFERTREIGLFRAVGATRRQTSMLIRWEGAIIAVFGGILGVLLGIVFGIIAVIVIPDSVVSNIAIPPVQLIIYVVIAALAGLIAAYFPARRAAKLNILDAISNE